MKYKIISVSSPWGSESAASRLAKEIKDYIKMGWTPQGGISIVVEGGNTKALQAITKPD